MTDWSVIDAQQRERYRSSRTRARIAISFIALASLAIGAEVAVISRGFAFVERFGYVTLGELSLWQRNLETVSSLYVVALIPATISYLAWMSRAVDNIRPLTGADPWVTPRWSIALWFVPLANLVAPYRVLADAWRSLAGRPAGRRPTIVLMWWLLWIGGGIAGRVLLAAPQPDTAGELNGFLTWFSVALVGQVVAGGILIWIIRQIERGSEALAARNAAAAPQTLSPVVD